MAFYNNYTACEIKRSQDGEPESTIISLSGL
jgi:hypothetical protein